MVKTDKPRRIRVAIYCRISLAKHGDQVKVDRQEKDCRKLCRRLGWDIRFVFVDNSRSAWQRDRKRPGWDALLETVDAGSVDAIVVYHGDRLIRQPWDLELLLRLADQKNLRLASPTGTRDLDSADDRFILRIEAAQACRESDNISRRVKRAKEARRAAGKSTMCGTRGFGRKPDGSILRGEAAIIREIVTRLLAGETKTSLWKEIVARGILTPKGNQWSYSSFSQMLARPDLAGLNSYRGEVIGPSKLTPIVDRKTWEALQLMLTKKSDEYAGIPRHRKHLQTRIAKCGSCQQGLNISPNKDPRWSRYRCVNPNCPAPVARNMQKLDAYVVGAVLNQLADDRLWDNQPDEDHGAITDLIALEARRAEVEEEFADDDDMKPASLRKILARIDTRLDEIRGRIAAQQGVRVLDGCRNMTLPEWEALPLPRQRAILQEVLDVTVYRGKSGRVFDHETVAVVPRELGRRNDHPARRSDPAPVDSREAAQGVSGTLRKLTRE